MCVKCDLGHPEACDNAMQRRHVAALMTDNRRDVLLALNLKQMQRGDWMEEGDSTWTEEIAKVCGRSNRSTASILSQVREFGWVYSTHGETVGWVLTAAGVAALERDREVTHA